FIAEFSCRGPNYEGETKPDIMAPGGVDTPDWTATEEVVCAAGLNQGVKCSRGTSMATPHIAGGLALLLEAGVADPVAQLFNTALELADIRKDNDSGFGTADFAKALNLPPPNPHSLTIETPPVSGVQIYVNNGVHLTPWSGELREGSYIISIPKTMFVDTYVYEFTQWEDGETSPTRTINLTADTTVKATYRKLNAYVIYGTEDVYVDEGMPNHNTDSEWPGPLVVQAQTLRPGVRMARRSFLKFDITKIP
ncbi:unnamed protein product, partial [marine sediment metagenome]